MANEESKEAPRKSIVEIIQKVFDTATPEMQLNYTVLLIGGTDQGKTAFLDLLGNLVNIMRGPQGIQDCEEKHQVAFEN